MEDIIHCHRKRQNIWQKLLLSNMESTSKDGWIGPKVALSDAGLDGLGGYCNDVSLGT